MFVCEFGLHHTKPKMKLFRVVTEVREVVHHHAEHRRRSLETVSERRWCGDLDCLGTRDLPVLVPGVPKEVFHPMPTVEDPGLSRSAMWRGRQ